ncbi:MAG: HAD-IA family hydrolase, partial [Thermanaerothrix sp.]|nr:HAD-IA family hydrolase [Thermanaerothrix sp.]
YQLGHFFRIVVTAQTTPHTKPFPDPILWAATAMGVDPYTCLIVGDTPPDIHAAKAAGAQAVGVLCGFGTERELRRAGADLILPSPVHLISFLPSSCFPP